MQQLLAGNDMDSFELKKILSKGYVSGKKQIDDLRDLVEKYPFFQPLRIMLLKSVYGTSDFEEELRKNIIYITDRKYLYSVLYEPEKMLEGADNEIPEGDRTATLIDSFLDSMDKGLVPCDVPADYASFLLAADGGPDNKNVRFERGNELIDSFIEGGKISAGCSSSEDNISSDDYSADADNMDDSCFTETLAKIYIKQKRYDKAVEIIRKLSLKYPKKNTYFANQLKELEKLIINNKIKE